MGPQRPGALVPSTALHIVLPKLHLPGFAKALKNWTEQGPNAARLNVSRELTREPRETKPGPGDDGPRLVWLVWTELSSSPG